MPMFVVKRQLPGITPDGVHGAGIRVKSCVAEMRGEGHEVQWLRSFFLPGEEQTHCYFSAPTAAAVRDLNERAQIPFLEITEVVEMTPDSV
ncbi:MAG TPA: nickel-binding protein [Longimicrobiales bacterium]|nr:nickel-binding protein [Longimicrobiales bacterium]